MIETALVAGATDGIGREVALGLARRGVVQRLFLVGRDPLRGAAVEAIVRDVSSTIEARFMPADLSLMREAARVAETVAASCETLTYLVHSAGTIGGARRLTADGIEENFAINYLSRFAITTGLIEPLRAGRARIVIVGGPGQRGVIHFDDTSLEGRWSMFRSLQQFQKANDVFTVEAARRWREFGVSVNVMSPGLVNTRIRREAGALRIADLFLKPLMRTPAAAAADVLTLLLDPPRSGDTGQLWSGMKRQTPMKDVVDAEIGRRLWAYSDRLTKSARA